jgi:sugar phosphate isomerase/epimerase
MTWRLGMSSGACVNMPILDLLPALHASGAEGIEVGTPPRHFDPLQPAQLESLAARLSALQFPAISIHAPFGGALDLADPNPHHRHAAIGAVLTAAEAIKRLGGNLVIVHPSDLARHAHIAQARLDDCAASLKILCGHCARMGVTLTIESPLPHLIGGHPDEFAWLLRQCDDATRVCLDTGHTSFGRQWRRFVEIAGARLIHVHANDNHGQRDDHLPPGDGILDWADIAASLAEIQFSGWIMLELRCPSEPLDANFRRAFEQASRLLRPASLAPNVGAFTEGH